MEILAHRFRKKTPVPVAIPQIEQRVINANPIRTTALAPGTLTSGLAALENRNTTAANAAAARVKREPKNASIPTKVTEIDRFIDLSPQTRRNGLGWQIKPQTKSERKCPCESICAHEAISI
jgi:hypothetical protein